MNDIRKLMDLVESIQLNEARHDVMFKEAITALRKYTDGIDDNDAANELVNQYADAYQTVLNQFEKDIPNTWKMFYTELVIVCIYKAIYHRYFTDTPNLKLKTIIQKRQDRDKSIGDVTKEITYPLERIFDKTRTTLTKYFNIPYGKIKLINPDQHRKVGFFNALEELEKEFKEGTKGVVFPDGTEEVLITFPDGYAWVDLNKESCELEGDAMGHCGNSVLDTGRQMLSLRKIEKFNGQEVHRPALTFILNDDGELGEMKGRANEKPNKKYHPYIIELLKLDMIEGIRGGGGDDQGNFSLDDLSDKDRNEILELKGDNFDRSVMKFVSVAKQYDRSKADPRDVVNLLNTMADFYSFDTEPYFSTSGGKIFVDIEDIVADTNVDELEEYFDADKIHDVSDRFDDTDAEMMIRDYLDDTSKETLATYLKTNYEQYYLETFNVDEELGVDKSIDMQDVMGDLSEFFDVNYKDNDVITLREYLLDLYTEACKVSWVAEGMQDAIDETNSKLDERGLDYIESLNTTKVAINKGELAGIIRSIISSVEEGEGGGFGERADFVYPSFDGEYDDNTIYSGIHEAINSALDLNLDDRNGKVYDGVEKAYLYVKRNYNNLSDDKISRIENILIKDAEYSVKYASNVLKGRFEKGEDAIKDSPEDLVEYMLMLRSNGFEYDEFIPTLLASDSAEGIVKYAVGTDRGRIEDKEDIIAQSDNNNVYTYVMAYPDSIENDNIKKVAFATPRILMRLAVNHNSEEALAHIATDAKLSYDYASRTEEAFPEGEAAIATDVKLSYDYARYILRDKFDLGEPAIATDAKYSLLYAHNVLAGRFELGEKAIATSASYSDAYATDVIKSRFPLGEPIIRGSRYEERYMKEFNITEW